MGYPYEVTPSSDSDSSNPDENPKKKRKYCIPITQSICDKIDNIVGTKLGAIPCELSVDPSLEPGTEEELRLIEQAKIRINLENLKLDDFQLAGILSLI